MVNASFLAFSMTDTTVSEERADKSTREPEVHRRALWQFLRYRGHELAGARDKAVKQLDATREQTIAALELDARFPWHLLALTDPPKFLSDIVESVLGAIYVDTRGDVSACEDFVRRLGVIDRLERILRDDVDCLHPKERLGRLAGDKKVRYVRITEDTDEFLGDKKAYRCQVKIEGEDVGGVVEGLKKLNAETVAAWKAVSILENKSDVAMMETEEDGEEGNDMFFDAEEGGGVRVGDW